MSTPKHLKGATMAQQAAPKQTCVQGGAGLAREGAQMSTFLTSGYWILSFVPQPHQEQTPHVGWGDGDAEQCYLLSTEVLSDSALVPGKFLLCESLCAFQVTVTLNAWWGYRSETPHLRHLNVDFYEQQISVKAMTCTEAAFFTC